MVQLYGYKLCVIKLSVLVNKTKHKQLRTKCVDYVYFFLKHIKCSYLQCYVQFRVLEHIKGINKGKSNSTINHCPAELRFILLLL